MYVASGPAYWISSLFLTHLYCLLSGLVWSWLVENEHAGKWRGGPATWKIDCKLSRKSRELEQRCNHPTHQPTRVKQRWKLFRSRTSRIKNYPNAHLAIDMNLSFQPSPTLRPHSDSLPPSKKREKKYTQQGYSFRPQARSLSHACIFLARYASPTLKK